MMLIVENTQYFSQQNIGNKANGINSGFQTSALHHNSPTITRIPAMALPLQEGPDTCSRNVSIQKNTVVLSALINMLHIIDITTPIHSILVHLLLH